jgi:hypothetical protein
MISAGIVSAGVFTGVAAVEWALSLARLVLPNFPSTKIKKFLIRAAHCHSLQNLEALAIA